MSDFDLANIGKKLRDIREREGLTQSQFAKKVKLSQAAISQFEDGKRIPSTKALQKIAAGLDISLDDLLGNQRAESQDQEKDDAIQALITTLKKDAFDAKQIIALNRYQKSLLEDSKNENE